MANECGWERHTCVISFPKAVRELLNNRNALPRPPCPGLGEHAD